MARTAVAPTGLVAIPSLPGSPTTEPDGALAWSSGAQRVMVASAGAWTAAAISTSGTSLVEVDFGSTPVTDKVFAITDSGATVGAPIVCVQTADLATGSVSQDAAAEPLLISAACTTPGVITAYAQAVEGTVFGKRKLAYVYTGASSQPRSLLHSVPWFTYGHSYLTNFSGQNRAHWPLRIPFLTGMAAVTERAVGNDKMRDTVTRMHGTAGTQWTPATKGLVVIEAMLNDVRTYGANVRQVNAWKLQATLLAVTARSSSRILESAATTTSGTWNAVAEGNVEATAPGAFKEFTATGTDLSLVVAQLRSGAGNGGAFEIRVDGVLVATGTCAAGADGPDAIEASAFIQRPYRFNGLSNGSHTVRITHTGTSGQSVYCNSLYVGPTATAPAPTVAIVIDPPLPNWNTYPPQNVGSDAALALYAAAATEVAAAFPVGEVITVDLRPGWVAANVGADGIHPNDAGAARIADVVAASLNTLTHRSGLHL